MLPVLSLAKKVVTSPIWLLWQLYTGIWWAFTDAPPVAAAQQPPAPEPQLKFTGPRTSDFAQEAAFEVIDSRPPSGPTPRPNGALRGGFVATLISSALLAWATNAAGQHDLIKHSTILPLWLWSTAMVMVTSLWAVKHVAERQAAEQPVGWRGNARCVIGGAKDMGASIAATTVQVKNSAVSGGRIVQAGAGKVNSGFQAVRRVIKRPRSA